MRFFSLYVAIILGIFATNAQNKIWLGGTVGLWSSKVKGGDLQLNYKIMPEIGYFLNENIGIAVSLGAAHTHGGLKFDDNIFSASESSENQYTIIPFIRYTFLKSTLGGLFVDGGVEYSWSKVTNGGATGTAIEIGFRPGITFNISSKMALIGKFGFLGYQNNKFANFRTDALGFDFDMNNIQFGASIKF